MAAMISFRSVCKWFGALQVLKDCSLDFAKGEVVVICGPSGSGKSTLIKCINGLEPFEQGTIVVDGEPVVPAAANMLRLRRKVSMVFQSFELYPHMTVMENVTLAPIVAMKQPKAIAEKRARSLLATVGMEEFATRWPGNLSGGQQQRVAIARALATDPLIVLFDEPTSALDPEMINEVLDVIVSLIEANMTLVIVTHEMGFARRVADRIIFMEDGIIVEDTPCAQFFEKPRSERAVRFLQRILPH